MSGLRSTLAMGACYAGGVSGFMPPSKLGRASSLSLSSPSFRDDGPPPNSRRPMDDPFAPSPRNNGPPPRGPPRGRWEEPPSVDLDGNIRDRQSNLAHNRQSVNEDPRAFDYDSRFSQRPRGNISDPSLQPRQAWWESSPSRDGRIQGGSRSTFSAPYDRDGSHVFLESDGRPIDTTVELYDGPNNTPTRLKVYSEDGRMRPINTFVENPQRGQRGNTFSIRNTGTMEFPIQGGVNSVGGGPVQSMGGGSMSSLAGSEGAYMNEAEMSGMTRPTSPSMARGERVQGGALKTFPLDHSVEAVQVTITTQGMPMNAKVELWGTSSHIKQVAEIYNDDGARRPFASIIDVPGGSNTVAVYNIGPMEYPIEVVVEPVARSPDWDGRPDPSFGGHLAPW